MNLDRLEQLLETMEPSEIRDQYAAQLAQDPRCEAFLRQFERLEGQLEALKTLETAPTMKLSKRGMKGRIWTWALPMAAVFILGLLFGSGFLQNRMALVEADLEASVQPQILSEPDIAMGDEAVLGGVGEDQAERSDDAEAPAPREPLPQRQEMQQRPAPSPETLPTADSAAPADLALAKSSVAEEKVQDVAPGRAEEAGAPATEVTASEMRELVVTPAAPAEKPQVRVPQQKKRERAQAPAPTSAQPKESAPKKQVVTELETATGAVLLAEPATLEPELSRAEEPAAASSFSQQDGPQEQIGHNRRSATRLMAADVADECEQWLGRLRTTAQSNGPWRALFTDDAVILHTAAQGERRVDPETFGQFWVSQRLQPDWTIAAIVTQGNGYLVTLDVVPAAQPQQPQRWQLALEFDNRGLCKHLKLSGAAQR